MSIFTVDTRPASTTPRSTTTTSAPISDARLELLMARGEQSRHFRDLHIATFTPKVVAPKKRKHVKRDTGRLIARPTEIIRPCTMGCGVLTRHSNQRLADYPGTRFRRPGGACTQCAYRAEHPDSHALRIEIDIERVRELRAAGMTVERIAAVMGCSKSKVGRDLRAGNTTTTGAKAA